MWLENTNAEYYNMMKFWEKLESKSSYHFPNSWWVRGRILLNTCHLKKLWRGQEDKRKPRTSELFESETLKQFNKYLTENLKKYSSLLLLSVGIYCLHNSSTNNSDVRGFIWSSWALHNFLRCHVFRTICPLNHHEFGKW